MISWFKRKKYRCFICQTKVDDDCTKLRYKYAGDDGQPSVDQVCVCDGCMGREYNRDMMEINDE